MYNLLNLKQILTNRTQLKVELYMYINIIMECIFLIFTNVVNFLNVHTLLILSFLNGFEFLNSSFQITSLYCEQLDLKHFEK